MPFLTGIQRITIPETEFMPGALRTEITPRDAIRRREVKEVMQKFRAEAKKLLRKSPGFSHRNVQRIAIEILDDFITSENPLTLKQISKRNRVSESRVSQIYLQLQNFIRKQPKLTNLLKEI